MKKTIYWITGTLNTHYYFDEDKAKQTFKEIKKCLPQTRLVLYKLETIITDENIEKMLNQKFNHCMFQDFQNAKSIDES